MTARFRSTSWTLVRDAREGRTPEAREALARLCEDYWQPLYGFVRRLGYDVERARDLTQGFFARLIEKDVLSHADPARASWRWPRGWPHRRAATSRRGRCASLPTSSAPPKGPFAWPTSACISASTPFSPARWQKPSPIRER